jgi:hypothetical protein
MVGFTHISMEKSPARHSDEASPFAPFFTTKWPAVPSSSTANSSEV